MYVQIYRCISLEIIYVNLERLKTGGHKVRQYNVCSKTDCMYKIGRLDSVFSGCFLFYLLFLTLRLRGRLEGGVVWGHGGPACWCWTAVFLWMLWLSQRWWRRKPLKNRERKHWVLQILAAQMWCWHGSICGLVVRASKRWVKKCLCWQLWQDIIEIQMTTPWGLPMGSKWRRILCSPFFVCIFFVLQTTSHFMLKTNVLWQFQMKYLFEIQAPTTMARGQLDLAA